MDLPRYLREQDTEGIAAEFGFKDAEYVEKLMVDFFMAGIIRERLDCTVRGGMCMPLHTERRLHRLSMDVDLLFGGGAEEVGEAMDGMAGDVDGVKIARIRPKNPYPVPNIASYSVTYGSRLAAEGGIKVDFLCGVGAGLPRTRVPQGYEVLGFRTERALDALDRPSLLADKITALALGKIGLKESKVSEVPKQVYDVAALIRSCSAGELESALARFPELAGFKIGMYGAPYTARDVAGAVLESVLGVLGFSGSISLREKPLDWYHKFKQTFLQNSGRGYNKRRHIADVMLVAAFARHLEECAAGVAGPGESAGRISLVVGTLARVSEGAPVRAPRDWRSPPFNPKILKSCTPEAAFLAGEIWGAPEAGSP